MASILLRFLFSERRPSFRALSPYTLNIPKTASTHQMASKALIIFGLSFTILWLISFANIALSRQFGVGQFGEFFPLQKGSV